MRMETQNYSENYTYFLTILCKNRSHLLGQTDDIPVVGRECVRDGVLDVPPLDNSENLQAKIKLSDIGKIVDNKLCEISKKSDSVDIDKYVIMPNHIHVLLSVKQTDGTSRTPSLTRCSRQNEVIPRFVSYLKRSTNKEAGIEIWHRSYYDHVIRDAADYLARLKYIERNPIRWFTDKYYTE